MNAITVLRLYQFLPASFADRLLRRTTNGWTGWQIQPVERSTKSIAAVLRPRSNTALVEATSIMVEGLELAARAVVCFVLTLPLVDAHPAER